MSLCFASATTRNAGWLNVVNAGSTCPPSGTTTCCTNRTGATGNISLELTAKAAPDGYTFVVFNLGHLTSALLSRHSRIDAAKDFAAVSQIATGTLMLASHAGVPAREALQRRWESFAKSELPDLSGKKK